MKHNRTFLYATITAIVCALAGGAVYAMTVDEAIEKLKTYKFGEAGEVLDFLHESVVGSYSDPALRKKLNEGLSGVLESEAAYDAKQFACRQLALTATAEQVPVLAKYLADEQMSHIALYVLTHIDSPAVDEALVAAMEKAEGRARLGIINMLGNRRCSAAIKPLGKLMLSTDEETAVAAIRALGRIGSEAARSQFVSYDGLADSAQKPSESRMLALAQANLDFADRFMAEGHADAAKNLYRLLWGAGNPAYLRAAALKGLAQADAIEAMPLVLESLSDREKAIRQMAVYIVQRAPGVAGQSTTQMLVARLASLEPQVQAMLIRALGVRGDKTALPAVTKSLGSSDPAVRLAALEAAGSVGDASVVGVLAEHAARTKGPEQQAARESLYSLRGADINGAIVEQMEKVGSDAKVELIEALGQRSAEEGVDALLLAARSGESSVSAAALQALRDLAGAKDVPQLVELLAGSDSAVQADACKTLVAVTKRCGTEGQVTELVLAKYGRAQAVGLRIMLLQAAGEIQDQKALPVLLAALSKSDSGSQMRNTAIKALGAWPSYEPAKALLDIARNSKDRTERVLALRGCIDLTASHAPADQKLADYEQVLKIAEDNEKRRVLGKLADIKNPAAMKTVQGYLSSPETANEAALAVTAIGEAIYSSEPEAVAAAMNTVRSSAVGEATKEQAGKILDQIEALKDYLLDWEVAGPYMEQGKGCTELFDIPFGPEIEGAEVRWRAMPVDTAAEHTGYLNLLKELNGGEQRVAYLRTTIESQSERPARLEIFSDDGVKAWLNGKVVHSNNVMRPIMPEPDRVNVTLVKGANRLMLKVTQNNLPWGAAVRLRD
jgi:HEAT repeat protein